MDKLFGTDGIRALSGNKPLDHCNLSKIAISIYNICIHPRLSSLNNKFVIGICSDERYFYNTILKTLSNIFIGYGVDVIYFQTLPTPSLNLAIENNLVDIGIMITASHNSWDFNGIKIFDKDGKKINKELQNKIEDAFHEIPLHYSPKWEYSTIGNYSISNELKNIYINKIINLYKSLNFKNKFKIVIDCANGACSYIMHEILEKLNIDYIIINNSPNGKNINKNCGALHLKDLSNHVIKNNAQLGVAFDGDGDRLAFVDEKGDIINHDCIFAAIVQKKIQESNINNQISIVITKNANISLFEYCNNNYINVIESDIGDLNVFNNMIANDAWIGTESNGHILFAHHRYMSDGLTSMIESLYAFDQFKVISECNSILKLKLHIMQNIIYEECNKAYIKDRIDSNNFNNLLNNIQRNNKSILQLHVRLSGTEPCVRISCQADSQEEIDKAISEIYKYLRPAY